MSTTLNIVTGELIIKELMISHYKKSNKKDRKISIH